MATSTKKAGGGKLRLKKGIRKKTGAALEKAQVAQAKSAPKKKRKGAAQGTVQGKLAEAADQVAGKGAIKKKKSKLPKRPLGEVNLFKSAVLFVTLFGKPGNIRKVRSEDAEVTIDGKAMTKAEEKQMFRVEKQLLNSPELKAIGGFDQKVRKKIERFSIRWPLRRGCYLIPIALLKEAKGVFKEELVNRQQMVDKFIVAYPGLIEEAKERLGPAYDPDQYASQDVMARRFIMKHQIEEAVTPESIKTLDEALFEEEEGRLRDEMRAMHQHVTNDIRTGILKSIRRFTNSLMPTKDGKRKGLYESNIENLMFFLKTFGAKNVVDDKDCENIVGQAMALIKKVGTSDNAVVLTSSLRSDDDLRAEILTDFDKIGDQLESMTYEDESRMVTIV